MARLLIVSLGKLSGAILESVARMPEFRDIVVATRNLKWARAKINAVRIGAALEGQFPQIDLVAFDFAAQGAGRALRDMAPDLVFAAPSLMPWWRLDESDRAKRAEVPFGGWLAFHLSPMLQFRAAWSESGLACPWIASSYPDVVNAILHLTGPGPIAGTGNVAECVPKIQLLAMSALGARPEDLSIRLVAQHSLEYHLYSDRSTRDWPPYLLQVLWHGHDVSLKLRELMTRRMPIPYDLDFNRLTASATIQLLTALMGDEPTSLHVPAPNGLVGGYPVRAKRGSVVVDLAPEWTVEQAIGTNAQSLAWDGIAALERDGTVAFTEATITALHRLTGKSIERLAPGQADGMAQLLLQRLEG